MRYFHLRSPFRLDVLHGEVKRVATHNPDTCESCGRGECFWYATASAGLDMLERDPGSDFKPTAGDRIKNIYNQDWLEMRGGRWWEIPPAKWPR